jgi:hypothetical protein
MIPEHEKHIQEEAKNISGQRWLEVFRALVDSLYTSRNKTLDKVAIDQAAAQVIEKELVQRLELGVETIKPQKGDEYR